MCTSFPLYVCTGLDGRPGTVAQTECSAKSRSSGCWQLLHTEHAHVQVCCNWSMTHASFMLMLPTYLNAHRAAAEVIVLIVLVPALMQCMMHQAVM
jgi:hypothetical protein